MFHLRKCLIIVFILAVSLSATVTADEHLHPDLCFAELHACWEILGDDPICIIKFNECRLAKP
jgi:hypothetical protein